MDYFQALSRHRTVIVTFNVVKLDELLKIHKGKTRESVMSVSSRIGLAPMTLLQTVSRARRGHIDTMNKATAVAIADGIGCEWEEFAEEIVA